MKFTPPSDTLNKTQRKSIGAARYVPRKRDPHEALPPGINIKTLPVYVPSRDLEQRLGIAKL